MPFNEQRLIDIVTADQQKQIEEIKTLCRRINDIYDASDGVVKRLLHFDRNLLCEHFRDTELQQYFPATVDGGAQRNECRFIDTFFRVIINMFYDDAGCSIYWLKKIRNPQKGCRKDYLFPNYWSPFDGAIPYFIEVPSDNSDPNALPYFRYHYNHDDTSPWINLLSQTKNGASKWGVFIHQCLDRIEASCRQERKRRLKWATNTSFDNEVNTIYY